MFWDISLVVISCFVGIVITIFLSSLDFDGIIRQRNQGENYYYDVWTDLFIGYFSEERNHLKRIISICLIFLIFPVAFLISIFQDLRDRWEHRKYKRLERKFLLSERP